MADPIEILKGILDINFPIKKVDQTILQNVGINTNSLNDDNVLSEPQRIACIYEWNNMYCKFRYNSLSSMRSATPPIFVDVDGRSLLILEINDKHMYTIEILDDSQNLFNDIHDIDVEIDFEKTNRVNNELIDFEKSKLSANGMTSLKNISILKSQRDSIQSVLNKNKYSPIMTENKYNVNRNNAILANYEILGYITEYGTDYLKVSVQAKNWFLSCLDKTNIEEVFIPAWSPESFIILEKSKQSNALTFASRFNLLRNSIFGICIDGKDSTYFDKTEKINKKIYEYVICAYDREYGKSNFPTQTYLANLKASNIVDVTSPCNAVDEKSTENLSLSPGSFTLELFKQAKAFHFDDTSYLIHFGTYSGGDYSDLIFVGSNRKYNFNVEDDPDQFGVILSISLTGSDVVNSSSKFSEFSKIMKEINSSEFTKRTNPCFQTIRDRLDFLKDYYSQNIGIVSTTPTPLPSTPTPLIQPPPPTATSTDTPTQNIIQNVNVTLANTNQQIDNTQINLVNQQNVIQKGVDDILDSVESDKEEFLSKEEIIDEDSNLSEIQKANKKIEAKDNEITELKKHIEELKGQYEKTKNLLDDAQVVINTTQSRLSNLTVSGATELQKRVTELSDEKSKLERENKKRKETIQTQSDDIKKLTTQIINIREQAKSETELLKTENEKKEIQITQLQNNISKLQLEKTNSGKQITDLELENKKLTTQIDDLKKKNSSDREKQLQNEILTLQIQIKQKDDAIKNLTEKSKGVVLSVIPDNKEELEESIRSYNEKYHEVFIQQGKSLTIIKNIQKEFESAEQGSKLANQLESELFNQIAISKQLSQKLKEIADILNRLRLKLQSL